MAVLACLNNPEKITLHKSPSWETSIVDADFVFIDGDHRWPALIDTLRALSWNAKVICLHDSNAWPRLTHCWGAHHAALALKGFKDRTWIEDKEERKQEATWRGFLVSRKITAP
jgi:hypothetical protein